MSDSTQVYDQPPPYPTSEEISSYADDARRAGRAKAIKHLRDGSPAQAFVAVVEATEAEARITGLTGMTIPAGIGFRALVAHARLTHTRRVTS